MKLFEFFVKINQFTFKYEWIPPFFSFTFIQNIIS